MGTRRRRRTEEESASSDGEDGSATTNETKTAKTDGDEGVAVSGSSSHYEQIRETSPLKMMKWIRFWRRREEGT
uniref:Uncharacterized protein n=1 Tax=Medicago truncatula TaxID=3880 RepID=Q2HV39_MEDTR|nr:hypothetical protein MtrDRAFT_AC148995g26v2 [Medicago truncatula]